MFPSIVRVVNVEFFIFKYFHSDLFYCKLIRFLDS